MEVSGFPNKLLQIASIQHFTEFNFVGVVSINSSSALQATIQYSTWQSSCALLLFCIVSAICQDIKASKVGATPFVSVSVPVSVVQTMFIILNYTLPQFFV